MVGGLYQLIAKGPEDIYLTNQPEVTLFKTIYRRYSNFSIADKILRFDKSVGFGSKSVCKLRKYGDLLHKLTLIIDLPEIEMLYKSLTNKDVYDLLAKFGITWDYSPGAAGDKVTVSQLPSIKTAIDDQIINLHTLISFINNNNLIQLNDLANVYNGSSQMQLDNGITFLENYIGGDSSGYMGIAYNGLDTSITPNILAQYNYVESYKKDNKLATPTVYNLGSLQILTYNFYVKYVFDRQYPVATTGDIISPTINTIIVNNAGLFDNIYKNWYIKTGIQVNRIGEYDVSGSLLHTFGNFEYIPSTADKYQLINTPSSFLSGTIANDLSMIVLSDQLLINDYRYYQYWYCSIPSIASTFLNTVNYDNTQQLFVLDNGLHGSPIVTEYAFLARADVLGSFVSVTFGGGVSTVTIGDVYNTFNHTNNIYNGRYLVIKDTSYVITSYTYSDPDDPDPPFQISDFDENISCTVAGMLNPMPTAGDTVAIVSQPNIARSDVSGSMLAIKSTIFTDDTDYTNKYIITNGQIIQLNSISTDNTVLTVLTPDFIVPSTGDVINLIDSFMEGSIVSGSSISTVTLQDSSLNTNNNFYSEWFFYCGNELHEVSTYVSTGSTQTITFVDNWINVPAASSSFNLFEKILEIITIGSATGSTVTFINPKSSVDGSYISFYLFCNNQLRQITSYISLVASINLPWTTTPSYGNVCYLIQMFDFTGTINQASKTSTAIIASNSSATDDAYTGWYFYVNNDFHQISAYNGTTKTITINDNWAVIPDLNDSYKLIESIDSSGTITLLTGNNIVTIATPTSVPSSSWYIFTNFQLYQITDFSSNVVTIGSNWINVPTEEQICYFYQSVSFDITGTVNFQNNTILTRIVPINSTDNYTFYYMITNRQVNFINYHDPVSNICIFENNWIEPLGGPSVNDVCTLVTYSSFVPTESGILINASNLFVSDGYVATVTLQSGASSINGAYVGWYFAIVSITGIFVIYTITNYDGTNKIALLDKKWINTVPTPTSGTVYYLYETISGINTTIDYFSNNIITLDGNASYTSGTYNNSYIKIKNEVNIIRYYDGDNRICILRNNFLQPIISGTDTYDITSSLPETGLISEKSNFVLNLQGTTLATIDDFYVYSYLNIGIEAYTIILYTGSTNNIIVDHSWTQQVNSESIFRIFQTTDQPSTALTDVSGSYATFATGGQFLPGDYTGKYIFCNNQLILISSSVDLGGHIQVNLSSNWLVIPTIGNTMYIYTTDTFTITGVTVRIFANGAVLHNSNLNSTDDYYDGWFLQTSNTNDHIDNTISQIRTYFGTDTLAVINETESVILNPIIIGATYKLFPRLLNNIEFGINKNVTTNTITLDVQSSKIDNYYKGWYVEFDNLGQSNQMPYQVISYSGTTRTATVTAFNDILTINSVYKLFNRISEDNIYFYNILEAGIYIISISLLDAPVKQLFDEVIYTEFDDNTTYIGSDAYNAYLSYFATSSNVTNVIISYSLNYRQILNDLLGYILTNIKSNMTQLQQIFSTIQRNIHSDPHFIFAFYDIYSAGSAGTFTSVNKIFTNASLLNISLTGDNFTNNFSIINGGYYSDYVRTSLINFHLNMVSFFNTEKYSEYLDDTNVWLVPSNSATLLLSTIDPSTTQNNMYVLNYIPLLVLNDLPNLIISRMTTYFANYYPVDPTGIASTFLSALTITINTLVTSLLGIIKPDLAFTDYDKTYLAKVAANSQKGTTDLILTGIFRPENTYDFQGQIYLFGVTGGLQYITFFYNNLTALEYVCYKIFDTVSESCVGFDFSNLVIPPTIYSALAIQQELIVISLKATQLFLTPADQIISYSDYANNNFSFVSGDASYNSYAISSIWFNMWNSLKDTYNKLFYQTLLSETYFSSSLGYNMTNLLNQSSDILGIDLNTYTNYYQFDTTLISSVNTMITNELNTFNSIFTSYSRGKPILGVKNLIIPQDIYYFNTFTQMYDNGIVGTMNSDTIISAWIKANKALANTIISGTRNSLSQFVYGAMDLTLAGSNSILTIFNNAMSSISNPFDISTNLYAWYNTYITDVSSTDFTNFINGINSPIFYKDITNIIGNYDGFITGTNISQYISDKIIKETNIKVLFNYIKGDWNGTYLNLLNYFNRRIFTYNTYLIGLQIQDDGTSGIYTTIKDAVTDQTAKFAWIKYLGYFLIDTCSVEVGGCTIDKHTGEYLYIKKNLDQTNNQQRGLNIMIGNIKELYTYDNNKKKSLRLYIPMEYWFCRDSTRALPLVAMNYTDVIFSLNTKKLEDVAYWSELSYFKRKPEIKCSMLAQYIFLDEDERKIISTMKHEQLIETVQYDTRIYNNKSLKNNLLNADLYFHNMCKEIIWTVQPTVNTDGTLTINGLNLGEKKWYEYKYYTNTVYNDIIGTYAMVDSSDNLITAGNGDRLVFEVNGINSDKEHSGLTQDVCGNVFDNENVKVFNGQLISENNNKFLLQKVSGAINDIYIKPINSVIINMNGNKREEQRCAQYYNYVEPAIRHQTTLPDGIYSYSFALYPNINQPSGALNTSKIENLNLVLEITDKLKADMESKGIKIQCGFYGITYNVFRVASGMAGLAFFG